VVGYNNNAGSIKELTDFVHHHFAMLRMNSNPLVLNSSMCCLNTTLHRIFNDFLFYNTLPKGGFHNQLFSKDDVLLYLA